MSACSAMSVYVEWLRRPKDQPRSQGLRGETVTKTLVKFVLSFQNFGEKIACAVRHNRIQVIQPLLQHGYVALRMQFFSQNFGTIKRILPGSSSPSHREGPGTEVAKRQDQMHLPSRSNSLFLIPKAGNGIIEIDSYRGNHQARYILQSCT